MAGFDLLIDFLVGVTLDETLQASLALPEYLVTLLLASGRTLVGAEEAARRAASLRTALWLLMSGTRRGCEWPGALQSCRNAP